ncbi:hypothetical protein [Sphingomonas oryzagri]|uniref:Uncharacterized protein n=1 Tax=Sphingomonas oryzagri TaxID=3042314 RepID=A0ABT6N598_9SPHN|nr:hypothetical protein [Sphingomonas oryzagri]MDH7640276.1 hypothetical protein [Sphingomonas oryzagri]
MAIAFGGLALPGCIAGPALPIAAHVAPDTRLRISSVHAYRSAKGVTVVGLVGRRPLIITPIWGHLHMTAYRTGSAIPTVRDAGLGALAKSGAPTVFSASIPLATGEALERLDVEYRARPDDKEPT